MASMSDVIPGPVAAKDARWISFDGAAHNQQITGEDFM